MTIVKKASRHLEEDLLMNNKEICYILIELIKSFSLFFILSQKSAYDDLVLLISKGVKTKWDD